MGNSSVQFSHAELYEPQQHLWETLSSDIFLIIENARSGEAKGELDPTLMEEDHDELTLKGNKWLLSGTAQEILSSIIRSLDKIPIEFRFLCAHLQKEVVRRYPDSKYSSIGGFIFLRFFNAAVTSPQLYGLCKDQPSPEAHRVFVLVTKVLQSLANGIPLGGKEEYMIKLDDFIQENQSEINKFFDRVATIPTGHSEGEIERAEVPEHVVDASLDTIYKYLYTNKEKVLEALDDTLEVQVKAMLQQVGALSKDKDK